jgi:hypothetical protein
LSRQLWRASADAPFSAGSLQASFGAFTEHRALELGKRPTICIIMRPAGVVVSIASVRLAQPLHDR